MKTPNLIITPRRGALLAGHDNVLDVLIRIQAPEAPADCMPKRPPLHLAIVIDRSGSMSGQPLEEAKRCAAHVIDGLLSTDRASLVVYDDHVQTLVPTIELRERARFHDALRNLDTGGSTDLHAGWLRGAETLAPLTNAKTLSRVILLSDGCANHGITDAGVIARQCTELAAAGVSTSTYGLGHHFNEELMISMARAGGGNSYYGQTAKDLIDPFQEEFALLNALCGRSVTLTLKPTDGVRLEMLNDYDSRDESSWRLPDLAFGGESWAVARLTIPASGVSGADERLPQKLLTASVRYSDLAGEPRAIQPVPLVLGVLPAGAYAALAEDELVARRTSEVEAAGIQAAARLAALREDWTKVSRLLKSIEALAERNPWLQAIVTELRELSDRKDQAMFAKEAFYSSRRMMSRLAPAYERPDLVGDSDGPSYLRRKHAQGKRDSSGPKEP